MRSLHLHAFSSCSSVTWGQVNHLGGTLVVAAKASRVSPVSGLSRGCSSDGCPTY
jgi:hypothetical protein